MRVKSFSRPRAYLPENAVVTTVLPNSPPCRAGVGGGFVGQQQGSADLSGYRSPAQRPGDILGGPQTARSDQRNPATAPIRGARKDRVLAS